MSALAPPAVMLLMLVLVLALPVRPGRTTTGGAEAEGDRSSLPARRTGCVAGMGMLLALGALPAIAPAMGPEPASCCCCCCVAGKA